jgi:NAD(P)-dependent dehydrogenase (short-subunit alcohol dehydrogenase family)
MASDRFSVKDQVLLAIGGTSGIGRQIALGFAEAGAIVIPVSRTRDKVDRTVAEIRAAGGRSSGHAVDVRDLDEIRLLVERVVGDHGRIDVLLNCQGTTVLKPAEEFTEADYDLVMDTNLKSVFFCAAEVGKHMLSRGEGSIINIASLSSYRGWSRAAIYSMSKWAVVSLTETLASEWSPRGVRVNAIAPGFFMTDLNRERMSPERKKLAIERTPMGRFGELEELVGAAIYLASPAARFVTGETIRVDGGYLAKGI